jgi:hypothetical protein
MEVVYSFETSVNIYQTTQQDIRGDTQSLSRNMFGVALSKSTHSFGKLQDTSIVLVL